MKTPYRKYLTERQSIKIKQLLIGKKATQYDLADSYPCSVPFMNGVINRRKKATPRFFEIIEELKTK